MDIDYNVWELGPVNTDLYYRLAYNPDDFKDYFYIVKQGKGKIIKNIADFDSGEFSKYDMKIINKIIDIYGQKKSTELVDITHSKGGLWYKVVDDNGIAKTLKKEKTSPFLIDFSELIKDSSHKKGMYELHQENRAFFNKFA